MTNATTAGDKLIVTYVPGLITAGTFKHGEQRDFRAVRNVQQAVAVDPRGEFFSRLIVQVPDPAATAKAVQKALVPVNARRS